MKRLFALFLVGIISLTYVTACSKSNNNYEESIPVEPITYEEDERSTLVEPALANYIAMEYPGCSYTMGTISRASSEDAFTYFWAKGFVQFYNDYGKYSYEHRFKALICVYKDGTSKVADFDFPISMGDLDFLF